MRTMEELTSDVEAVVREYFASDESKVDLWFNTPNPWLGGLPPRLYMRERELLSKLHNFVMDARASSRLVDDTERALAAATELFANADQAAQWLRDHEGAQEALRYLEMLDAGDENQIEEFARRFRARLLLTELPPDEMSDEELKPLEASPSVNPDCPE